jgi:hypothetical protein
VSPPGNGKVGLHNLPQLNAPGQRKVIIYQEQLGVKLGIACKRTCSEQRYYTPAIMHEMKKTGIAILVVFHLDPENFLW